MMDRLQKKCIVVSTGMHLLLAFIFVVGSAFTSHGPARDVAKIDFDPFVLTDSAVAGGGNPKADRPLASRAVTPPAPRQVKTEPPAPKVEPKIVKEVAPQTEQKTDPESFETNPRKHKIEVSKKLVTKNSTTRPKTTTQKADETAERERERAVARQRQELASELAHVASELGRSGSSATPIVIGDKGPGGGGPSYAGIESWIQKVYLDSWVAPQDPGRDSAVAKVSVTIARNGSVIDSQILSTSGDTSVDASVRETLRRVTTIGREFPESIKDKQRTYILVFDLKAKRGLA
jgi:TonB family protein